MLFNFHICVSSSNLFLLFISNFIPLWPENILCVISMLLNILRFALWPSIGFILADVPCALEKSTLCGCWAVCSVGLC